MGIISSLLYALFAPGDRVVSVKDTYGGTNIIFTEFLPKFKMDVTLCDTTDHDQIETENSLKVVQLLYLESPTNPTKVTDIARLTAFAHKHGALVVVDNTFATPINQKSDCIGSRSGIAQCK